MHYFHVKLFGFCIISELDLSHCHRLIVIVINLIIFYGFQSLFLFFVLKAFVSTQKKKKAFLSIIHAYLVYIFWFNLELGVR